MGARPMARLIQDKIRKPLAEEILFGKLEHGGIVRVTIKDGEPHFEFEAAKKSETDREASSSESKREPVS
jgi:ATP-dependent Clp protease ATP-binding subunit ClpA